VSGEECGAAFFRAFGKAPHDEKTLLIRALRHQLRAGFVPERPDAAVITPAVVERIKRISLQPCLIERLGLLESRGEREAPPIDLIQLRQLSGLSVNTRELRQEVLDF
jgi:hypothetical protein